jgi:hypothetical protein
MHFAILADFLFEGLGPELTEDGVAATLLFAHAIVPVSGEDVVVLGADTLDDGAFCVAGEETQRPAAGELEGAGQGELIPELFEAHGSAGFAFFPEERDHFAEDGDGRRLSSGGRGGDGGEAVEDGSETGEAAPGIGPAFDHEFSEALSSVESKPAALQSNAIKVEATFPQPLREGGAMRGGGDDQGGSASGKGGTEALGGFGDKQSVAGIKVRGMTAMRGGQGVRTDLLGIARAGSAMCDARHETIGRGSSRAGGQTPIPAVVC